MAQAAGLMELLRSKMRASASRRLGWWTWLVPFAACLLGTLALRYLNPGARLFSPYWPLALGLVMALWWGPRVLPGVYLSALLTLPLVGIATWARAPLLALPETATVALGWLLLSRAAHIREDLGDARSLLLFLLVGMVPVALLDLRTSILIFLAGQMDTSTLLQTVETVWLGRGLDLLMVAIPLLTFVSPLLAKRGWLRDGRLVPSGWGPPSLKSRGDWALLALMLAGLVLAAVLLRLRNFWMVYTVIALLAAVRYGFGVVVTISLAAQWLIFCASLFFPEMRMLAYVQTADDSLRMYANQFLLTLAVLTVGRVISELRAEIRRRKEVEDALVAQGDIAQNMQIGLCVYHLENPQDERSLHLVRANPAANRLAGLDLQPFLGKSIFEIFPHAKTSDYFGRVARVARGEETSFSIEVVPYTPPGGQALALTTRHFTLPGRNVAIFIENNTEARRSQNLLEAQHRLGEALADLHDLDEGLRLGLQAAVEASGMDCGGVYRSERVSGDLVLVCWNGVGQAFVDAVQRFSRESPFWPVFSNPRRFILDRDQEDMVRMPFQAQEGLCSIAAVPIFYQNRMLGYLDIASHTLDKVSDFTITVLETIAGQMASWIARVEAETALQEREERFRAMIENSSEVISILAPDGKVLYSSPGVERVRGFTSGEVEGRPMTQDVHPEDRSIVQAAFLKAMTRPDETITIQIRVKHKDGRWIWVEALGRNFSQDPQVGGIVANYHDITARKQAEDIQNARLHLLQLAGSVSLQELLTAALDDLGGITSSPIGFLHFLEVDQVTISLQAWSTRTTREMCSADELESHFDLDRAGVWADAIRYRRAVVHNDYPNLEGRKGLPEGHAPVLRELVVPVLRQERIVAILGIGNCAQEYSPDDVELVSRFADMVWDIAEGQRAIAALAKNEKQFRDLVDSSPIPIYVTDRGEYLYCNQAACRVLGGTEEDLRELNLLDFLSPEFHDPALDRLKASEGGVSNPLMELKARRLNGETFLAESVSVPIQYNDRAASLVMFRDITEERRAAEVLRASLEEKNALLKEIHHRVKNNMQIMISLLDLQALQMDDPAVRELFLDSENRIRSMALVHEQLYRSTSLARIEFGAYLEQLAWDLYSAYGVPASIELDLQVEAVSLDIETAIPCGLIVNELITNAFKHAFPEGRGGKVTLGVRQEGEQIRLMVADDGIGIPAALDVGRLDSLGMKLIYLLARQIDADLVLEREPGTCFKLSFRRP